MASEVFESSSQSGGVPRDVHAYRRVAAGVSLPSHVRRSLPPEFFPWDLGLIAHFHSTGGN